MEEPSGPGGELDELRNILFGPGGAPKERIERLEERIERSPEHAEDVSRVLSEAFLLRAKRDKTLSQALQGPVGEAIGGAVKRNPQPVVDAITPIIGPAIRKSIRVALAGLMEGFERAVQHSLSPRALLWRIDAWRTGRPFSEVVLLKTMLYRVEQVYLIHRETGLLLRHVTAPAVAAKDADLVSSMLTAIQDFVRDSFDAGESDSLESFRVGEYTVRIEQGAHAVLAAVVRGNAPAELTTRLQETLERIEGSTASELENFSGDASAFELVEPELEACLLEATRRKRSEALRLMIFFLALAGVLLGSWWIVHTVGRGRRFREYVARLDATPGIVVTSTGEVEGAYVVSGLRDPLAPDPMTILEGYRDVKVEGHWRPYQAMEPEFIARRAKERFDVLAALIAEATLPLTPLVTRLFADLAQSAKEAGQGYEIEISGSGAAEARIDLIRSGAEPDSLVAREGLGEVSFRVRERR